MKKILILFLTVFLTFIFKLSVFAEDTVIQKGAVLTLEECLNIAFDKNPNIDLAKNNTKVYQSRIGQEKARYLPQISLSSGYGRQNSITSSSIDKDNNHYSSNITLNQLVYDFGKTPLKAKIQKLNLESVNLDVEDKIILTSYNVKQAYYSALSAKISRDVFAQSINQYEKHLQQAKAFFEVGTKSKIDVTTSQVNLSNVKLSYIKADSLYKMAIASLSNAMGQYNSPEFNVADTVKFKRPENLTKKNIAISYKTPNAVFKSQVEKHNIVENLSFEKYNITLDEAIKKAFENRPDLKSLIMRETVANESVKLSKKEYYPDLQSYANYGYGGQEFPLNNGWSFGTNLNIPVFNGLLTKNQIKEAKANVDIVKSSLEILKQNIYLQVQQAYISLTQAEKSIPVAELVVKQAKENFELANGRYNVGVGNSIEVNDAEISYNNAQLAYVQAFYDYNLAYINLERAIGVK